MRGVGTAGGEQQVAGVLDDSDLRLGRAQHHQHRQRQQYRARDRRDRARPAPGVRGAACQDGRPRITDGRARTPHPVGGQRRHRGQHEREHRRPGPVEAVPARSSRGLSQALPVTERARGGDRRRARRGPELKGHGRTPVTGRRDGPSLTSVTGSRTDPQSPAGAGPATSAERPPFATTRATPSAERRTRSRVRRRSPWAPSLLPTATGREGRAGLPSGTRGDATARPGLPLPAICHPAPRAASRTGPNEDGGARTGRAGLR